MASGMTVRVDGLSQLGERMRGLSEDMNKKIARSATAAAASVIVKSAKQKAPSDTGNLRKNIISKRLPASETQFTSEHIATVRTGKLTAKQKGKGLKDAYYAVFVEHGTVKMPAQPFMRPAFQQNKEHAIAAMKDRIEKRLKRAGV